jgi:hypothetical protein
MTGSRHEQLITDRVQWSHEDHVDEILASYDGHFDATVCGRLGPGGEDWGSLTILTDLGAAELAPLDTIFRLPGGPIVIASPEQLRTVIAALDTVGALR